MTASLPEVDSWSGDSYDRVSLPQLSWGKEVLDALDLRPGAHVLDAGCGSGRVTEVLLQRWPDCAVLALDSSAGMIRQARERLARFGGRVAFLQADLSLGVGNPGWPAPASFDAVLSTGTCHWVLDHAALFDDLARVLRPGGQLVCQGGGQGSIADVRQLLDRLGVNWRHLNNYSSPEDAATHARAAGLVDVQTWLRPEVVTFPDAVGLGSFLGSGVLSPYLTGVNEQRRQDVVASVVRALPDPSVRFVRLNVVGRTPLAESPPTKCWRGR